MSIVVNPTDAPIRKRGRVPGSGRGRGDLHKRFWGYVQQTAGCWVWTGPVNSRSGYGLLSCALPGGDYRSHPAHRVSWVLQIGPIPEGLVIDHKCRNRRCVNPDHLRVVTPQINATENVDRPRITADSTSCIHGHPLDNTNTVITTTGRRRCRECLRLSQQRRNQKLRDAGYVWCNPLNKYVLPTEPRKVDVAGAVRDAGHLVRIVSPEEEREMQAMEDDCESDA